MKVDKNIREEILKLRNKGMSLDDIAKTLGMSKPNVVYHLKMAEIEQKEAELKRWEQSLRKKEEKLKRWEEEVRAKERAIEMKAKKIYESYLNKYRKKVDYLKQLSRKLEERVIKLKNEEESLKGALSKKESLKKELKKMEQEYLNLKRKKEEVNALIKMEEKKKRKLVEEVVELEMSFESYLKERIASLTDFEIVKLLIESVGLGRCIRISDLLFKEYDKYFNKKPTRGIIRYLF